MKILIVSATPFEIAPLMQYLNDQWHKKSFFTFTKNEVELTTLVTGVGANHTTLALASYPSLAEYDHIFNLGIAGTFDEQISLGSVIEVSKDRFGDLGIEERDGTFTDVFELDLLDKDMFPYSKGWISNHENKLDLGLIKVTAITVNKVHGEASSINRIKKKYNPHLESMEGAAFMYVCKSRRLSFYQIRAVSNLVEPRNRANWKVELAIDNLNSKMIEILSQIDKTK